MMLCKSQILFFLGIEQMISSILELKRREVIMKKLYFEAMKSVGLFGNRQGMALGMIMIFVLAVSILGGALMTASRMNAVENSRYLNSVKAFWLADAGVQKYKGQASAVVPNYSGFTNTVGDGEVQVRIVALSSNLMESVGKVLVGTAQEVVQRIQFRFAVLPTIYEKAIYGANVSGIPWTFMLRGTNQITRSFSNNRYYQKGGRDIVMGDVFANGDVKLYQNSMISNAPAPNTYGLLGDIEATGTISNDNSAIVRGGIYPNSPTNDLPSLRNANYALNNTWNVANEFNIYGADSSGRLPASHPLRNVVKKNPSDRSDENNSTTGNDYYFEPNSFTLGVSTNARTSLNLGVRQVYYVDGHVWFNSGQTFGFLISGTATIAASRDVHISDNIQYATANDLLGLVAAGTYNSSGQLQSGGDVYFGDPNYGTLYTADAFMLAANNFYYNTSSTDPSFQNEPDTGFQVYGNYAAMNQVNVYRDWYHYPVTNGSGRNQVISYFTNAARFIPGTNRWQDVVSGNFLSSSQTNTLRHYQMIVKYDERIRNQATQPPGLPGLQSGTNGIYKEIYDWQLIY
jgi:hypothetical protein